MRSLFCLIFLHHDRTAFIIAAFRACMVRLFQGMALGACSQCRTVDGVTGRSVHASVGLGSFTFRDAHGFLHSFPVVSGTVGKLAGGYS